MTCELHFPLFCPFYLGVSLLQAMSEKGGRWDIFTPIKPIFCIDFDISPHLPLKIHILNVL